MSSKSKRAVVIAVALIAGLGAVFFALRGCTLLPWGKSGTGGEKVFVCITRDLGKAVLKSEEVKARSGDSVMDVLKSIAAVETEYGGGFVSSIDGLRSAPGTRGGNDWFYFVNGLLANVGASEYEVRAGDLVWWDYHVWNQDNFIPAVVGAYPRPFTSGYSGEKKTTVMLYCPPLESAARQVGAFLEGRGATVEYRENLEQRVVSEAKGPVIVFSTIEEAAGEGWIKHLLDSAGGSQSFLALDGDRLVSLDSGGNVSDNTDGLVAAVVATGSGLGDPSPVWLVICAGKEGAAQAVRIMASEPEALRLKFGIVIDSSGAVYQLPR